MTNERKRRPGVKPRAEYLESSISRNRPWEAEGLSRSSWYRLRRQVEWRRRQSAYHTKPKCGQGGAADGGDGVSDPDPADRLGFAGAADLIQRPSARAVSIAPTETPSEIVETKP